MYKKLTTNKKVMESLKRALTWEEIKFILMLLSPIVAIFMAYSALNADLAVIKSRLDTLEGNHLVHIQNAVENNSAELVALGKEVSSLQATVANHTK